VFAFTSHDSLVVALTPQGDFGTRPNDMLSQHVINPCVGITSTLLHLTSASLWQKQFVAMSTPSAADTMDRTLRTFLEGSDINAEGHAMINPLVRA
jgi:hypothetical protein